MRRYTLIMLWVLLFTMQCGIERNSPLDEKSGSYIPPAIIQNAKLSTIKPDDTIHFNSGIIYIIGNRDECIFLIELDNLRSDEWKVQGAFPFSDLTEGRHIVHIQVKYETGTIITRDSIIFFVKTEGFRPAFTAASDTTISMITGSQVELRANASGADTLIYEWFRNDTAITDADSPTLTFSAITESDSGEYYCKVKNSYGNDKSRFFTLHVKRPEILVRNRILYDKNGADSGNVPEDKTLYSQGEQITLADNSRNLVKNENTFAGWSTQEDNPTIVFSAGSKIIMDTSEITMYAVWTKQPLYQIVYHRNGAQTGNIPIDRGEYLAGASIAVAENYGSLAMTDSIFSGWGRARFENSKVYVPGDTLVIGTSDTLFAHWKAKKRYTLTYHAENTSGGSVPEDNGTYLPGRSAAVKGNSGKLEKTGSTFVGWSSDKSGYSKRYAGGDTLIFDTSDVDLYAVWSTRPTYTITYDKNSATSGDAPEDNNHYEIGQMATVQGNSSELRREGFSFVGWSLMASAGSPKFNPGDLVQIENKNLTLFAVWTNNPTYTITYVAPETIGEPPIDAINYESGATVKIKDKGTLQKTGFSFVAWSTSNEGNGDLYLPESTLAIGSADDTLFAVWQLNTYTIRFEAMGGTPAVDSQSVSHGSKAKNPAEPKLTNFTFDGWFNEAKWVNRWDTNTTVTVPDTLYAKWLIKTNPVVFNAMGGSTISSQDIFFGGKALPPKDTLRTGHDFKGWFTDSSYSGTAWNFSTDTITAKVTLFAKWSRKSYDVSFSSKWGTLPEKQRVEYGTFVSKPADPVAATSDFGGWYKDSLFATSWNFTSDSVVASMTLIAKWTIKKYNVTFMLRNGSADQAVSVEHGAKAAALSPEPQKTGCDFKGWFKDSTGTTAWVFATEVVAGPVTLYAKWEDKTFLVQFNTHEATSAPIAAQTVTYGSKVTLPTQPQKTGHSFVAWYADSLYTSVWNFSTATVTAPVILHAKWNINPYTVTFDTRGGSSMSALQVNFGSAIPFPANPTKPDYIFSGWYSDSTCNTAWLSGKTVTGNVTLYAKWVFDDQCGIVVPSLAQLTANPKLTDPFKFLDGTRVTRKSQWNCRRNEIKALAQAFLYGTMPPKPENVTGTLSGSSLSIECIQEGRTISFSVSLSGSGTTLVIDFGAGVTKPTDARSCSFDPAGMLTKMKTLYPGINSGLCIAAAWGVDRIIDVIEANPAFGLDPAKVVVTGCSTNGKMALAAGAFCERVALTIPVEGGAAGTSSWRVSSLYGGSNSNTNCQDIEHLEQDWLGTVATPFRTGSKSVDFLPIDQHEIVALIAPRPIIFFNNNPEWIWLCAKANVATAVGAHAVYKALGVPENMGFAEYAATIGHCTFPAANRPDYQAFYDKFLSGSTSANTNIMKWSAESALDTATWIDWDLEPELQ